jgi:hypothetical protein
MKTERNSSAMGRAFSYAGNSVPPLLLLIFVVDAP